MIMKQQMEKIFECFVISKYPENSKCVRFNVPAVDLSSLKVALLFFFLLTCNKMIKKNFNVHFLGRQGE